jgi:hypothetical protein
MQETSKPKLVGCRSVPTPSLGSASKQQSTDGPEFIDGELLSRPLQYCLHPERYKNQPDDFNIHHLRGWHYGDMIIALADKDRCPLYKAWQHLMHTRFHDQKAENHIMARQASR